MIRYGFGMVKASKNCLVNMDKHEGITYNKDTGYFELFNLDEPVLDLLVGYLRNVSFFYIDSMYPRFYYCDGEKYGVIGYVNLFSYEGLYRMVNHLNWDLKYIAKLFTVSYDRLVEVYERG